MDFQCTVTLTAPAPLTEDNLFDLAELGGAASGWPAGTNASTTFTTPAATAGRGRAEAAERVRSVLPGCGVDDVEAIAVTD